MREHKLTLHTLPGFLALTALSCTLVPLPALAMPNLFSPLIPVSYEAGTKLAPDNSARNKGDQSPQAQTADHAGNQMPDRDIMSKIRRTVMKDKSLSNTARNIKIISKDGKVTLRGPVKTDEEKQNIEAKAISVAGNGNVVNDLSVKGAH